MYQLFYTPSWFNGFDLVFEGISLIVALFIADAVADLLGPEREGIGVAGCHRAGTGVQSVRILGVLLDFGTAGSRAHIEHLDLHACAIVAAAAGFKS